MKFIKIALLMSSLLIAASADATKWVGIGTTVLGHNLIDTDSAVIVDTQTVEFKQRLDYVPKLKTDLHDDGTMDTYQARCMGHQVRLMYSQTIHQGRVMPIGIQAPQPWLSPDAESVSGLEMSIVCQMNGLPRR